MRWILLTCPLLTALAGCTTASDAADTHGDEAAIAHKMYVAKCAKCHKFHDPVRYSDEEWRMWMRKMIKKAKLTEEQAKMLSRYIDETFRREVNVRRSSR